MATQARKWVLGHLTALVETRDRYGMVYIHTPPRTPGPPPHYHEDATELFLILRGNMEVICDGQTIKLGPGESFVIPRGSVHTFANNSDIEVEWVTSYAPDGFQTFFADLGVDAKEDAARERSVSPEIVKRVGVECEKYGMILAKMPEPTVG